MAERSPLRRIRRSQRLRIITNIDEEHDDERAVLTIVAAFALAGGVAFAHGDAEHVQGTVTSVTATTITMQIGTMEHR